jgi:hypothetical protein
MAAEVLRLYRAGRLEGSILAMGGHEDGIIAWGKSAMEAGLSLVAHLTRAL